MDMAVSSLTSCAVGVGGPVVGLLGAAENKNKGAVILFYSIQTPQHV